MPEPTANETVLPPCGRCGHSPDWHRLDDSKNISPTDPAAEFRCLGYDCEADGPLPANGRACWCHDYSDVFIRVREAFRSSGDPS